jgi:tetratricopeptide (TPR) repeat protein
MLDLRRFLGLTGLVLGSVMAAQLALGQSGPARGGAVGTSPGPPVNSPNLTQPMSGTDLPQRGWFLSGKVAMDDGSIPPESVTIQRTCNGVVRPVAYTGAKGRFSFEMNQPAGIVPDASVGGSDQTRGAIGNGPGAGGSELAYGGTAGAHQLVGCELEASLPGYRSDTVDLTGRRLMDSPDVGTIILHRIGAVTGSSISATSYSAPEAAKKAFRKGLDAQRKQKWPEAQAEFEKAVHSYPKYAAAWAELGTSLERQGQSEQAHAAYLQSIAADQRFLKPYFPLALMEFGGKKWKEAADATATLVHLDPVDYPVAYMINAISNSMLGHLDLAEESARQAVKLDLNHRVPRAEYVLGCVLAEEHKYGEALPLMKSYIQRAPNTPDNENIKKQISQIETLVATQSAPPQSQQ